MRPHRGRRARLPRAVGIPLLLLLVSSPQLPAQGTPLLTRGSRVRLHVVTPKARQVRGMLVSAAADSLRLLEDRRSDTVAFSTASVSKLEVGAGRSARTGKGAALGFGIGAGLGLVLGVAAAAEGCSGFCTDTGPEEIAAVAVILGGVGAGFGALIGSASRGERWVPAPAPWLVQEEDTGGTVLGAGPGLAPGEEP